MGAGRAMIPPADCFLSDAILTRSRKVAQGITSTCLPKKYLAATWWKLPSYPWMQIPPPFCCLKEALRGDLLFLFSLRFIFPFQLSLSGVRGIKKSRPFGPGSYVNLFSLFMLWQILPGFFFQRSNKRKNKKFLLWLFSFHVKYKH